MGEDFAFCDQCGYKRSPQAEPVASMATREAPLAMSGQMMGSMPNVTHNATIYNLRDVANAAGHTELLPAPATEILPSTASRAPQSTTMAFGSYGPGTTSQSMAGAAGPVEYSSMSYAVRQEVLPEPSIRVPRTSVSASRSAVLQQAGALPSLPALRQASGAGWPASLPTKPAVAAAALPTEPAAALPTAPAVAALPTAPAVEAN